MTVCSWCDHIIERPVSAEPVQVLSHGICRDCLTQELARLRPTLAPLPVYTQTPALN